MKKVLLVISIFVFGGILSACGSTTGSSGELKEINFGYFPNLDHAAAIVGVQDDTFQQSLGDVTLNTESFPDGNSFIDSLDSGAVDIGYLGPGPAINYFLGGNDIVILAGAANGATLIVAREGSGVETLEDMDGSSFCTPGNGCTHNVQLEQMLLDIDLTTNRVGGTVEHQPNMDPASTFTLFENGQVDVVAAPEPWGTYIVHEGLGNVLVEWDDVQWGTTLPSVVLVSTPEFVENHPEEVKKILEAHIESVQFANDNVDETLGLVNEHLYELTQTQLPEEVLSEAWERMNISHEIDHGTLQEWADSSNVLGFIDGDTNLDGFVDTTLLDEVLGENQ